MPADPVPDQSVPDQVPSSDDVPLLRCAKRGAEELMEDLSEEHWAAGWMSATEHSLWEAVQAYPTPFAWGMGTVRLEDVRTLKETSEAAGAWFDGNGWVPLDLWRERYARWVVEGRPLTLLRITFDPEIKVEAVSENSPPLQP